MQILEGGQGVGLSYIPPFTSPPWSPFSERRVQNFHLFPTPSFSSFFSPSLVPSSPSSRTHLPLPPLISPLPLTLPAPRISQISKKLLPWLMNISCAFADYEGVWGCKPHTPTFVGYFVTKKVIFGHFKATLPLPD